MHQWLHHLDNKKLKCGYILNQAYQCFDDEEEEQEQEEDDIMMVVMSFLTLFMEEL